MTKAWFTHLIQHYPKAYYQCLYEFRDYYAEDWKARMRDADQLINFFADHGIAINLDVVSDADRKTSRYGFRIKSLFGRYEMQGGSFFDQEHHAKWAALEFAFFLLNFQKRQREKAGFSKHRGVTRYKR